jgi:tetratricopeptide (TPR) repeat protein
MKKLLPLVLVATVALTACSQATEKLNSAGNDAFANQDYAAALAAYEQASTEAPELAQPHFNAANAYYRQENYPAAQQQIEQTLIKDDGSLTQDTVYNLGNTFFQGEQYEQAIVAYQEALRLNPEDMEAKHNLELALQQQQEQQQDQQQDQNQDQQQENQDQNNDQQDQQQEGQQGDQQQDQQQEGQPGDQQQDQQSRRVNSKTSSRRVSRVISSRTNNKRVSRAISSRTSSRRVSRTTSHKRVSQMINSKNNRRIISRVTNLKAVSRKTSRKMDSPMASLKL